MAKFIVLAKTFVRGEEGASAAEYALMLGVVAAAVVTAVGGLRTAIITVIGDATAAL